MKKMRILLVVTLICCCICFGAVADIASGTCGDNLTWKLDDDGKLTVSGTGAMTEYANGYATPWYSLRSSILSVEIQSGVTSIGKYAFYECQNLQSVTSEGSISSIGYGAFYNCTSLKSVTIKGNKLEIGELAFCSCSAIESVTLEGSVSSIGNLAFQNSSLKNLKIPGSDLQIGSVAFYLSGLESVTLEGSVSSIGESAFQGLTNLKSMTIPASNLQIGSYAFYLSGLENVTLEGTVSSIGNKAFMCLTNLKSMKIPGSDLQIGERAFFQSGLESVTLEGSVSSIGESAFQGLTNLKSMTIPGSDLRIEKEAFFQSGLESVTLEGSVSSIGDNAFLQCANLHIWYCGTQDKWNSIPKGDYWAPLGTTEFHYFSFTGTGTETDAYIIETNTDWNTLSVFIEKGSFNTSGKHFQLISDDALPVSTTIGTQDNPFKGIFDGGGKTMTLNLDGEDKMTAPFLEISGATIKNLKVDGTVRGGNHSAGLVGAVKGDGSVIENCGIGVTVTATGQYCGGVLGHGRIYATTIRACVFSGSITGTTYAGIFWGWSDDGATPVLKDCLDWSDSPFSIGLGEPDPKSTVSNCYYKYPEKEAGTWFPWSEGNRGKLIRFVIPDAGVNLSSESGTEYGVSGITAFPAGMFYGDNLIAGKGDEVPLHPRCSIPEGKYARYYGNGKLLTVRGAGDTWMLTMPDENVTISAEFSTIEPYGRPTFRLPAEIESIGEDAFEGIKVSVVYVPDTCKKIEAYAFKNCPNLKQIRLPKDCDIDDAAFYGCTELMAIYSSGDGTTKDWAVKNRFGYMTAK